MLGAFIRAHRENLPPPKAGGRRRTPGWRREELADAAGLGVTWITWLEQGREVNASVPALVRLAGALRLTAAERASLFDLAGKRDPDAEGPMDTTVPPAVLALPQWVQAPAYLLDHGWTARAWNAAAAELFVGWLDDAGAGPGGGRNLLRYVFGHPQAQALIVDWPARSRRLVAEFRADVHRRAGDAEMKALVADLRRESAWFAQCWRQPDVLGREGGERQFAHPVRGALHYEQTTLLVAGHTELKLVCLTPLAGVRPQPRKAHL